MFDLGTKFCALTFKFGVRTKFCALTFKLGVDDGAAVVKALDSSGLG